MHRVGDKARHRVLKICLCVWVNVYVCNEANLTKNFNSSSYSNTTLNWKVWG